ncbi:MAG: UbiA family prenyltransferase [bacterium]
MKKFKFYIWAYIRSMRPALFLISGSVGILGIVLSGEPVTFLRVFSILSVVFIGWGVNQVINDLLGLKEDRINAPHRPLLTGELPISLAWSFSLILFLFGALTTFILNPLALFLYVFVFLLNIIYEYAKGIPMIGNLVFAFLVPSCLYYAVICMNGQADLGVIFSAKLAPIALALYLINNSLCFFTYYKDYEGDKFANKKTLVVFLGPGRAKRLNYLFSLAPFVIALPFVLRVWYQELSLMFFLLIIISFMIIQYASSLFCRIQTAAEQVVSLRWNFLGVVLFQLSFVALATQSLAMILFLSAFLLFNLLYSW